MEIVFYIIKEKQGAEHSNYQLYLRFRHKIGKISQIIIFGHLWPFWSEQCFWVHLNHQQKLAKA